METLTTSSPRPYLLFFRNSGPENYQHLGADERPELIARWNAWFDALVASGKAVEGQPLDAKTRVIAGESGTRVIDGPFPEAKEAIGGYVKLMVGSFDEATEIARRHPGLSFGMQIEIREPVDDCHLGVNILSRSTDAPAAS